MLPWACFFELSVHVLQQSPHSACDTECLCCRVLAITGLSLPSADIVIDRGSKDDLLQSISRLLPSSRRGSQIFRPALAIAEGFGRFARYPPALGNDQLPQQLPVCMHPLSKPSYITTLEEVCGGPPTLQRLQTCVDVQRLNGTS